MASAEKTRILSIDDEGAIRALLKSILERAGYEVAQASDGATGLETARRFQPHVIILDVQMPGLDGFETCQRIKSDPQLKGTPVIMCTSGSSKEHLISAIRAGAEDYLVKPFTPDSVLARVYRALHPPQVPLEKRPPPGPNRRGSDRVEAHWSVSWSAKGISGFATAYKCRMIDVSFQGMAFEFNRCGVCTGYEKGTVHPQCLFAPVANKLPDTSTIDFIISVNNDIMLEIKGKIAHVLQLPSTPNTEKVGVQFVEMTKECADVIQQYVTGGLQL